MGAVGVRPGRAAWWRLDHAGAERHARVVAPAEALGSVPRPAVLALHGGLGVPRGMALMTGLDAVAAREGFVVAYPAGVGRTWNAGACCGAAVRDGVDDVGFLARLIEGLVDRMGCDPGRVFVTGMSNGGMLAYRLAAERPDMVTAIAPVAAGMVVEAWPAEPVSLLAIHGTLDRNAPYEGGVGPRSLQGTNYPPVRAVVERWAAVCGCRPDPSVERTGSVTRERWRSGPGGVEATLLTVDRGGHSWPGGRRMAAILDPPSPALDASEEIWRFFQAHARPGGAAR